MIYKLLLSTWQTMYMIFLSSIITICGGIFIAIFLYLSNHTKNVFVRIINKLLKIIINITRSIPYIILLILLYPITKFVVGSTIGTSAAIVPLTIAALPFYARLAESSISEVNIGLVEALNAMGASKINIIFKVLLPESKILLIKDATLTIIGIIGYSAMAGIVGGGGLGDLTYFQGYNDNNSILLYGGIIILVSLVQLCQSYGNYLVKVKNIRTLWIPIILMILGCSYQWIHNQQENVSNNIMIGYIYSKKQYKIMSLLQKKAKEEYGINIKLIEFSDYNMPNKALSDENIDMNIFQHIPFLKEQVERFNYDIVEVGKTFMYPIGLFSSKLNTIADIRFQSKIAIPNDPTNRGRALLMLSNANLIRLKKNISWKANLDDITENPYKLKFITLQTDQISNYIDDVDLAVITNDYIDKANLTLNNALIIETKISPFANVMVTKSKNKNNPVIKKILELYQSNDIKNVASKVYPYSGAIPAW